MIKWGKRVKFESEILINSFLMFFKISCLYKLIIIHDDDEGGVNLGGDGDDDWGFATEASKEEDESPGAPQAAAPAPPPLPE